MPWCNSIAPSAAAGSHRVSLSVKWFKKSKQFDLARSDIEPTEGYIAYLEDLNLWFKFTRYQFPKGNGSRASKEFSSY
jgi:hypothetical protein